MGPGQSFWLGLGHFFDARVVSSQVSPQNPNFVNFFLLGEKNLIG